MKHITFALALVLSQAVLSAESGTTRVMKKQGISGAYNNSIAANSLHKADSYHTVGNTFALINSAAYKSADKNGDIYKKYLDASLKSLKKKQLRRKIRNQHNSKRLLQERLLQHIPKTLKR